METRTEEWRAVAGYEGLYEVSNLGRVRSLDRTIIRPHPRNGTPTEYHFKGRIMKPVAYPNGYLTICLKNQGVKDNRLIHRLVGKAFVPGYFDGADINHKNENISDNRAENLEWCTRSYNLQYNGRAKRVGIVQGKEVEQWTLDGVKVATFPTTRHAERATGIQHQRIIGSCKQKYGCKTAGGFRWKYKE